MNSSYRGTALAYIFAAGFVVSAGSSPAASLIHVGKNVQVSASRKTTPHYETLLAADPSDPRRLMACSMYETARPSASYYGTIVYVSANGGTSWKPTLNVTGKGWGTGDPACAFGRSGHAYFAELGERKGPDGKFHGHTILYASNDGGETWGPAYVARQSDREYITVDTTGRRFDGRVYVNGAMDTQSLDYDARRVNQIENDLGVLVSTDHGRSFHLETLLSPLDNHYTFADGNAVVLRDGTYVVLYPDLLDEYAPSTVAGAPMFGLKVISSTDGGFSFTTAVTVAKFANQKFGVVSIPPSIAADTSAGPFRDRLYVAWAGLSEGRSQVLLSHSSDRGKTWSPPVTVSDDVAREPGKGPDDNEPIVAVNSQGIVGVSWMDRRDSADDLGYYERFTASFDGGETFLPSVRVATAPATFYRGRDVTLDATSSGGGDVTGFERGQPLQVTIGYNSRFAFIGGDTEGLVADSDGMFHALWVDNRTGVPQVWTAPIRVDGRAVLHGSSELAHSRDITNEVAIEFGDPRFNRADDDVSIDAYLVNTSKAVIHGPVEARLITLSSQMGTPRLILGSSNGVQERGAIIDFTRSLHNEMLVPHERGSAVHLVFRLYNLHANATTAESYADSLQNFVTFTTQVFGQ